MSSEAADNHERHERKREPSIERNEDSSEAEADFDRFQHWKRRHRRRRDSDGDNCESRDRSSTRSWYRSSNSEDERGKVGRRRNLKS